MQLIIFYKCFSLTIKMKMKRESMKMGYIFGPNMGKKFEVFSLLWNWSPQNSYKHYKFGFKVKRQIMDNYVAVMIFFVKIISVL